MILFTACKYLKYLLFSGHSRGHGIHSPFVYELICRTFRNKIEPDIVLHIEAIRKKMISDQRSIAVTDLGSGSERMNSCSRKISDIVKYSAVPEKYGALLFNLARDFGAPLIVEFGTSLGISTLYLAASSPEVRVYTMEGCQTISEIAAENFKTAGFQNIKILNGPFDLMLPVIKSLNISPGLVFIDGNHRKEPVISYFNTVAEIADHNSVVVIDDIYSSKGMAEAWYGIREHENVTLTIDIFRMGIVFFRKGFNRNNFTIRY